MWNLYRHISFRYPFKLQQKIPKITKIRQIRGHWRWLTLYPNMFVLVPQHNIYCTHTNIFLLKYEVACWDKMKNWLLDTTDIFKIEFCLFVGGTMGCNNVSTKCKHKIIDRLAINLLLVQCYTCKNICFVKKRMYTLFL